MIASIYYNFEANPGQIEFLIDFNSSGVPNPRHRAVVVIEVLPTNRRLVCLRL